MDGYSPTMRPRRCAVAPALASELTDLRLWALDVPAGGWRSTEGGRMRLRHLSDRFRGAQAVALRRDPVPSAYRVLFRHLGLDPDVQRVPAEEVTVRRLLKGEFCATNRTDDALLVGLVETGVPLWALDGATIAGELQLRLGRPGEGLGHSDDDEDDDFAQPMVSGDVLVIADERAPVSVLFEPVAPAHAVTKNTVSIRLFAVQAPGVPEIFVEEAFDAALGLLDS